MVDVVREGFLRWPAAILLFGFAALAGTFLFVVNPGLFWDDWVWVHQSAEENLVIGRELGIWWAGYLSNFIASVPNPVLFLRLVALFGWIFASAGFCYSAFRRQYLTRFDAILVFLLLCASHAALVRFTKSVAMYNVYIACFWVACAVLFHNPSSRTARLVSAALFFFSFHLNSLLSLYALVLVVLFIDFIQQPRVASDQPLRPLSPDAQFKTVRRGLQTIRRFMSAHLLMVLTPVVFVLTIKLTSFVIVRMFGQTGVYNSYNRPYPLKAIAAIFEAPLLLVSTTAQYLATRIEIKLFLPALACAAVLLLLTKIKLAVSGWREIAVQYVLALIVFMFAMLPYLAADKPPLLGDFYEARHILPALPAIVVLIVAAVNTLSLLLFGQSKWQAHAKLALLSVLIALSIQASTITGIGLLKDFVLQQATRQFIQKNADVLRNVSTIIVHDKTLDYRLQERRIWNYEYTGLLVDIFGSQKYLGISSQEIETSPASLPLLNEPRLRKRYNLALYDPTGDQAIIKIQNSKDQLRLIDGLKFLLAYWRKQPQNDVSHYFDFSLSMPYLESRDVVGPLKAVADAVFARRERSGTFPVSDLRYREPIVSGARLVARGYLKSPHPAATDDLSDLAYADNLPKCLQTACKYIYMSDGVDFKLLLLNPLDGTYVKQAYGDLVDIRRSAYGYWSKGAAAW